MQKPSTRNDFVGGAHVMSTHFSRAKDHIDTLGTTFQADATKGVTAILQIELFGEDGGTYHVTVQNSTVMVSKGVYAAEPTVNIKMSAADWVKMANGEINRMRAFKDGRMMISGNIMIAMRLHHIFPQITRN